MKQETYARGIKLFLALFRFVYIFASHHSRTYLMKSSQRDKIEAFFIGALLGFVIFDLMEQQKRQTARIQALRKRLQNSNGLLTDTERLSGDWQKVRQDLKKASEKQLAELELDETF